MYTAMAAVAAETGDEKLFSACRALWENIVNKRMYITGGIGSTHHLEAFTIDYDLPNDSVYAETCASIAMVFFARKMLEAEPRAEYADIMERELFNGVLSGMQLDGKKFFYVNPLEVVIGVSGELSGYKHALPKRPEWYACACCPPNVSRLITSLGQYAFSEKETIYNHLYIGGSADFAIAGGVQIEVVTNYPWEEKIFYKINPAKKTAHFDFAIRIPAWSEKFNLKINGEEFCAEIKNGYAKISREWKTGDEIILTLDMKPRRIYATTKVRANAGCVALMRGPLVYCFEECDNGEDLSALRLPRNAEIEKSETVNLHAKGFRLKSSGELYSQTPPHRENTTIKAIPYYAWGNRKTGGMRVWILEG
jgi:hypothetical protein